MTDPDWQQILSQHGPMVWRRVRSLLGNEHDALDCYQGVFQDALKISKRETVKDWSKLLGRIARLRSFDLLRRRYRFAARIDADVDPGQTQGPQSSPDDQLQAAELLELLRAGLARLSPLQAEVFLMRYVDELSYQEIADRTESNSNAVGGLLSRARVQLRTFLEERYQVIASPEEK